MERLFYELKPWFFTAVALWAISHGSENRLMTGSGFILALSAFVILSARHLNRRVTR